MLDNLKLLLGIMDTDRDDLLNLIIDGTAKRLSYRFLAGCVVPDELSYIVLDVSAARFNRISSEGMSHQTVEGESLTFSDDDFKPYLDDITGFLDQQDEIDSGVRRVRFL